MTSDPNQVRAAVLARARQPDGYAFLQGALPLLEQQPDDDELRLLTISGLARLGLTLPALELAEARPELTARQPELRAALAKLQAQAQPPLPWDRMRATFAQNYPTAVEHHDTIRENAIALQQALERVELFRTSDGNLQASRRVGDGPRRWLPSIVNWRGLAESADVLPQQELSLCKPYFLEGLGFGELLERIWTHTRATYLDHGAQIHVCELNLAQVALWLHTGDRRAVLRDPRVRIWCGKRALEAFAAYCTAAKLAVMPVAVIRQPGWGPSAAAQARPVVERLNAARDARANEHIATIRNRARQRDSAVHFARRFAERATEPLRILGITSRHTTYLQFSMRDIQTALRKRGHDARVLIESDHFTPHLPREYILSEVAAFDPDLLLILDHNRWEFGELYDYEVPYCNWIQDDLPYLFHPGVGRGAGAYDLFCGLIGPTRAAATGYPVQQCKYLPMPVSLETYHAAPISDAERERYACDMSFVSNLSIAPDRFLAESREKLAGRKDEQRILGALYEVLGPQVAAGKVPSDPHQTVRLIQRVAGELGIEFGYDAADALRQQYAERLLNIFYRQQPLLWAKDLGLDLRLYGRGWKHHPQLGKFAQGVAHNGQPLRCIHQATRINLQLFPSAIVHQRLLEGLCSGGFFLIRGTPYDRCAESFASAAERAVALGLRDNAALERCEDETLRAALAELRTYECLPREASTLHDYALIGQRLDMTRSLPRYAEVSFHTKEQFAQRVARYLTDPLERDAIANAQRAFVEANFTHDLLVEELLTFAADYFGELAAPRGANAAQPAAAR